MEGLAIQRSSGQLSNCYQALREEFGALVIAFNQEILR
jgi:hypothetical protein